MHVRSNRKWNWFDSTSVLARDWSKGIKKIVRANRVAFDCPLATPSIGRSRIRHFSAFETIEDCYVGVVLTERLFSEKCEIFL